ncbi:gliding motility-associated C-terminal domain-containing protein [Cytophagaceae bacterium ABcell3]|nr:gliding motility-associated C-terminal domain-containing protein [Cytophagaceae bacterium ABcell3]
MIKPFSVFALLLLFSYSALAQCGDENIEVTNWCENQFAEWEITNPDPNARYRWYQLIDTDGDGIPDDTINRHYGANANGTRFISPTRYSTPDPEPTEPGWDERTFYYVKESPVNDFIPFGDLDFDNGQPAALEDFTMNLSLEQDIRLHSVNVPVVLYNTDNTFHLQIRIGDHYSDVFHFSGNNATEIGNQTYAVTVPVNLNIEAGDYEVEVITAPANPNAGTNPIDGFRWWDNSPANSQTFEEPGIINAQGNTSNFWGADKRSVLFDWNFTAYCEFQETPPATRTTEGCCTPVLAELSIDVSGPVIVSGTDEAVLTAIGYENNSNYFQWYKDGDLLAGVSGPGATEITVSEAGNYTVREVVDLDDIDNVSCYAEGIGNVQERSLFVRVNDPQAEYCLGDEIELEAYGEDISGVTWAPASIVSDPNSRTTTAILSQTGSIEFTAEAKVFVGNVIVNGDFEDGSEGFYTDMTESAGTPASNQFRIDDHVTPDQPYWSRTTNQDPAQQCQGDGNFFYADGFAPNQEGQTGVVWRQTVNVSPNNDYVFSMDHANISWDSDPHDNSRVADTDATLHVFINGTLYATFTTDGNGEYEGVCRWKTDTFEWNSENNTSATIEIRQPYEPAPGRDFAMDNIMFGGPMNQTAAIEVGPINSCFDLEAEVLEECNEDEETIISATTNGIFVGWEEEGGGTATIANPTLNQTAVTPTETTNYIATARFQIGNKIENGDFELGNQGFTTDLNYNEHTIGPGSYGVTTDPSLLNENWFVSMGDVTSGEGYMMILDPNDDDETMYRTQVNVQEGVEYAFSSWIANIHIEALNPPQMRFIINGEELDEIDFPENTNDWFQFSTVWTSDVTGTIDIELHNINPSSQGNDFALDELVFAPLSDVTVTDTVTVEPCCVPVDIVVHPEDTKVCETNDANFSVEASASGTSSFSYQWQVSYDEGISWLDLEDETDSLLVISEASASLNEHLYRVVVASGANCPSTISDSAQLTIIDEVDPGEIYIDADTAICANTTPPPILNAVDPSGGDADETFTFLWEYSTDEGNSWTLIDNEISDEYTPNDPIDTETWYRRIAINGPCDSVPGSPVIITIKPQLLGGEINSSQSTCYNVAPDPVTSESLASGGDGEGTYTYTWQSAPLSDPDNWTSETGPENELSIGPLTESRMYRRMVESGDDPACNTAYSDTVTITVYEEPTPGIIGDDQVICYGDVPAELTNIELPTEGDSTEPYAYRWLYSEDENGTFGATGGTGSTFQPQELTATAWFVREVSSGNCPPQLTDAVEVYVNDPLEPGSIQVDETQICAGASPGTITEDDPASGGGGGYTYIWEKSEENGPWEEITGENDPEFTPENITVDTRYRRVVSTATCDPDISNIISITVLPGLNPGVIESDQIICYGATPAEINSVAPASGGDGSFTYSWQSASEDDPNDWSDISGENSLTFSPGSLTESIFYRRVVVSGTGECNTSATSPVLIRVNEDLTPGSIGGDQKICENDIPSEITELTPATGGTGFYTYTWEMTEDNGNTWTTISGGTDSTYSPPALSQSTIYRRLVTSDDCGTVTSNMVEIDVTPLVPVSVEINEPGEICLGEPVVFTADPENEGANPVYRWEINGSEVPGETSPSFTTSSLDSADVVRVILTSNAECPSGNPATSNEVTMVVNDAITPSVAINTAPEICEGEEVNFTATPSGGGTNPTYEWFVNNVSQGPEDEIATWSSDQLQDGDQVHVIMTSNSNCIDANASAEATSNTHTMVVNENMPVSVSIIANPDTRQCEGTEITFEATPTNGGATPTYQWHVNGQPRGMNNQEFKADDFEDGDQVYVILNSSLNCKTGDPATSNIHVMQIDPIEPVSVSLQGPTSTICENELAEFVAIPVNGGSAPEYRWFVNGQLHQETTHEFAITTLKDQEEVRVELISSIDCPDRTAHAQLNADIFEIPEIAISPDLRTLCASQSPQLLTPVAVEGEIPDQSSYTWAINGTDIPNGSTPFYPADSSGTYTVRVTFPAGCDTISSEAMINIIPDPSPQINEDSTAICEGDYATFTVESDGGSLQWYLNGNPVAGETGHTIHANEGGLYSVIENNNYCEQQSMSVPLTVIPNPIPFAGEDITTVEGAPVQLHASGGESFQWHPEDGLSDPYIPNPTLIAEDNITYTVEVSNGDCVAEDQVNIIVQKPVIVRNSFTPNGDNINDTWYIENLERFPDARIEIYNRWGNLVWLSEGPAEWDGTNFRNNEILPVATYYYVIILNSEVFDKPLTGHVTIVR